MIASIIKRNLNKVLNGAVEGRYGHYHSMFRIAITTIVIIDILAAVLSSFTSLNTYSIIFEIIAYLSALLFSVEYALRIYSAPMKYRQISSLKAKSKYLFSFFGLVDLFSILPFILPDLLGLSSNYTIIMEASRLLLVLKLARYSQPLFFMFDVIKSVRTEMIFGLSASVIILLFSSMLIYYVEREAQPEAFYNIGQGFWWAIITFATVGYGDIYPITMLGKIVASLLALFGIGMIALPTGIISYAFLNKMNEMKQKKAESKKLDTDIKKAEEAPLPTKGEQIAHTDYSYYRYCPYCGTDNNKITEEKSYCHSCGKKIL